MWKITRDYINPRCGDPIDKPQSWTWDEAKAATKTLFKFRLLDDEGEVYFHGVSTSNNDSKAFQPLDDFGCPGYGCTMIEYKDGFGNWKAL